jgi:hypothetical protein
VTFRGHPPECDVLGADTRGVDEHMLKPGDPAAFVAAVGELIADADKRRALGEATATEIRATHTEPGWLAAAEELYALAAAVPPVADVPVAERDATRLDVLVELVMAQTGYAQGLPGAVRDHLAFLPLRERVAAWRRLTRAGRRPPHGAVVPEWLMVRLSRYRQLARDARPSVLQRRHA